MGSFWLILAVLLYVPVGILVLIGFARFVSGTVLPVQKPPQNAQVAK